MYNTLVNEIIKRLYFYGHFLKKKQQQILTKPCIVLPFMLHEKGYIVYTEL
jgi:hypothetical protein